MDTPVLSACVRTQSTKKCRRTDVSDRVRPLCLSDYARVRCVVLEERRRGTQTTASKGGEPAAKRLDSRSKDKACNTLSDKETDMTKDSLVDRRDTARRDFVRAHQGPRTLPNDFRSPGPSICRAPREKGVYLDQRSEGIQSMESVPRSQYPSTLNHDRKMVRSAATVPAFDWRLVERGSGSLAIVECGVAGGITMKLDIRSRWKATTRSSLICSRRRKRRRVTWTMTDPYPYINRVFGTIFNHGQDDRRLRSQGPSADSVRHLRNNT